MKPKLIILLDAFGEDYYNESNYLKKLGDKKRMESLFGYQPVDDAFLSGNYPCQNNIWFSYVMRDNSLYKSTGNMLPIIKCIRKIFPSGVNSGIPFLYSKLFGITNLYKLPNGLPIDFLPKVDLSLRYHLTDKRYPNYNIFSFCRENNIYYKFIISNVIFDDNGYKIFYLQQGKDETAKSLFIKNLDKKVHLYFVHLTELDKIGHEYLCGSQVNDTIFREENMIKEMVEKFLKMFPEGEFIIFGDHGMAPIKNYINPHNLIDFAKSMDKELCYFIDSTFLRIYSKKLDIKKLKEMYGHEVTFMDDTLFKKYKVPTDRIYGDIIVSVKPYELFYPNFFNDHRIKGMHGYSTEIPESSGCLISNIDIEDKYLTIPKLQSLIRG